MVSVLNLHKDIVFTLQSIKSRIETNLLDNLHYLQNEFLLYSPLNQGLKLYWCFTKYYSSILFLLYSPLNQGLKPPAAYVLIEHPESFYSTVH